MANSSGAMSSNPFFMIVGLGVGAAALIAIAIAATSPTTGDAVGSGPEVEVVAEGEDESTVDVDAASDDEMVEEDAPVAEEPAEDAPVEDAPAEEEPAATEDAAADDAPLGTEGELPLDVSEAEEEATDGDVVGSEAPDTSETIVETSGDAVTPEDTDVTVETVPADDVDVPAAGDTLIPNANDGNVGLSEPDDDAFVSPEVQNTDVPEDEQTPSGLETDLVVDPDRGAAGGPDPDGGAEPFFPTPSGPEGGDADALTVD